MTVHPSLADWYRRAQIEPSGEQLEKRMLAIESILAAAQPVHYWLDLVRLAAGRTPRSNEIEKTFHMSIQEKDPSFGFEGTQHERRVVACCVIGLSLVRSTGTLADAFALSASCLPFPDKREAFVVPGIVNMADEYLLKRGALIRKRPVIEKVTRARIQRAELKKLIAETPPNNPSQLAENLGVVLTGWMDCLDQTLGAVNAALTTQGNFLKVQDEELNIVWWLFGRSRRRDNAFFGALDWPELAVCAAMDLATLTVHPVGPVGWRSYISAALTSKSDKFQTVQVAYPSFTSDDRIALERMLGDNGRSAIESTVRDLVPLLHGFVDAPKDRAEAHDASLAIEDYSQQLYLEISLIRAIAALEPGRE